jgi:hypothetical protein
MSEKKSNTAGKALRAQLHRAFCVTTGTHCRMELQGKRVLFIQGCRDIEEYSTTRMVLRVQDASLTHVCVTGEGLLCCSYHEDGVEITGDIMQLTLCGQESAKKEGEA